MQGQTVLDQGVFNAGDLHSIPTESLAPGIYTFEAHSGRWSKTVRIIVQ
jgi:hypothetical protein